MCSALKLFSKCTLFPTLQSMGLNLPVTLLDKFCLVSPLQSAFKLPLATSLATCLSGSVQTSCKDQARPELASPKAAMNRRLALTPAGISILLLLGAPLLLTHLADYVSQTASSDLQRSLDCTRLSMQA
jgi:hypothetical protein